MTTNPQGDRTARFGETFAVREFQVLWLAISQSGIGDQLAKLALSILVYDRTGSPFLTAMTYGVTYLPYLLAGPLLSPLADRYRRREVLIGSDLVRAVLVALMVVPGLPLWVLFVLVFVVGLARPPFDAARSSILPDILPGDLFVTGTAVTQTTSQVTQVLGFAVGGAVVATIGAPWSLAVNAASFALSALLIRVGVHDRPAPAGSTRPPMRQVITRGTVTIFRDRRLRALIGLGMLAGFYVVPEALAVPYVKHELGLTATYAGGLLAAAPLGIALGTILLTRLFRPSRRVNLMGPLAVVGLVALLPFALTPGFYAATGLLFVSGVAGGYNLAANAAFVSILPNVNRGQALGLAQTLLFLAQGVATMVAGAVTAVLGLPGTICLSGAVGIVVACWSWFAWQRAMRGRSLRPDEDELPGEPRRPRHRAPRRG
ncbi:MAG: MFS transporter [Streptosporangiales bacterium]|nr:MFS transporter [Streptosporangiales bacterium]MBO0892048.1 MFS transporter [Acidothermales bacterium]